MVHWKVAKCLTLRTLKSKGALTLRSSSSNSVAKLDLSNAKFGLDKVVKEKFEKNQILINNEGARRSVKTLASPGAFIFDEDLITPNFFP